jgi:hypothetical protein
MSRTVNALMTRTDHLGEFEGGRVPVNGGPAVETGTEGEQERHQGEPAEQVDGADLPCHRAVQGRDDRGDQPHPGSPDEPAPPCEAAVTGGELQGGIRRYCGVAVDPATAASMSAYMEK